MTIRVKCELCGRETEKVYLYKNKDICEDCFVRRENR